MSWHGYPHGRSACRIRVHDCVRVRIREVEAVPVQFPPIECLIHAIMDRRILFFFFFLPEEQRAHERQLLEIFEGNRLLEQLPLLLKGEEFVDEFTRVREEVMIVVFVSGEKIEKDGLNDWS